MINNEKYSCMSDLGAELLMVISAFIIASTVLHIATKEDQEENLFLSSAYTIFLPLMSYLFSQANQYNSDGGAQVILIWMVFIEIIHLRSDPIFTWTLRKSGEQLVRLCWVGYLICSYAPLHGIRVSLLVLCIYFGVCEVLKGIIFNKAKDSYLIGKNPNIIHNYVERIMLQDDLHTTPMNICDYIVMGEENHEIEICGNGYVLGKKKSSSEGKLTIGRVFQLSSAEDEVFTLAHPYWRDVCLSFALAKMLRPRLAKLPVDEAGCRKSLDFVLEGIIDYIGSNRDIQTDENDGQRNPTKRVFSIIQEELKYVSNFLHIKLPIFHYLKDYTWVDWLGYVLVFGNGVYLAYTISKWSTSIWLSLVVEKAYDHCFFNSFRPGSMVVKIFSRFDLAITILLFIACIYIQYSGSLYVPAPLFTRWSILRIVEEYIEDPTKWNRSHKPPSCLAQKTSFFTKVRKAPTKTSFFYPTIFDLEAETIFFCIKVDVSTLASLPKWIRRTIPRSSPAVICSSTDAKEAILKSLRKSDGRLTNGEISLKTHGMDHLNWACLPHDSTTETILVWHIATTLLHNHQPSPHQNNDPHRETESQQNNNPFKEKKVALALSSYCHYLVKYLPDLLPDELDFTEKMYERVQKEILDIHQIFDQKPTTKYLCSYALQAMWVESSVVGKGARLAKDLMNCAEDEAPVWTMLAEFWAEMILFLAPSDNVDGHEKLLDRDELITQL